MLISGMGKLKIEHEQTELDQLLAYLHLLRKWNNHYNLTSNMTDEAMVVSHLLDSLSIGPLLPRLPSRIIDIGTGAGLPGLVLAIVYPMHHFTLLDSNGKKTRFLTQVCIEQKISNCEIIHARATEYKGQEFDIIVSRALSSLLKFFNDTRHLLNPTGHWWAMKGKYPKTELAEIDGSANVADVIRLEVPNLNEQRHLVIARPKGTKN